MLKMKRQKAFTLVELLIVIVVIGVLSAMMMLSSTEAVVTAKASNIISDLTTLKRAVWSWYVEHVDCIDADGLVFTDANRHATTKENQITINPVQEIDLADDIAKYMSGTTKLNLGTRGQNQDPVAEGSYGVCDGGKANQGRNTWFVGYKFKANEAAVKAKLKKKGHSGLIFAGIYPNKDTGKTDTVVWLKVFGDLSWDGSKWVKK